MLHTAHCPEDPVEAGNTLSEPESTNGVAGDLGSHTQAGSKQETLERE